MPVLTEREIRLFGFDRVRESLAYYTVTPVGREDALSLMPLSDYQRIVKKQRETTEACCLLEKGHLKLTAAPDIRSALIKVSKGGILDGAGLSGIRSFIDAVQKTAKQLKKEKAVELSPVLSAMGGQINGCRDLFEKLNKSVGSEGEILDTASPLLGDIRRGINVLAQSVQEKTEQYIKSPSYRKYLQEPIVTIRNERYVIPVKKEFQTRVTGIFHDQSASGATVFIEPFPIVELQNRLQQQKKNEEKEKERILADLSVNVDKNRDILHNDMLIYSSLDLIMARGQLSYSMKALEPVIVEESIIEMKGARHPLLKEKAVPVDFYLGDSYRVLVITGPNTGGKTVTLKTVGLLAVMAQSGLHLPIKTGTKVGVMADIRADIGDEQSIEQSLSTFSSHLNNIIKILGEAGPRSLVLLDELGAGTDPSEGAALARAILMELYSKGSLVVATTHINDLKVFAQVQEGVNNASLEFDAETLSPTYRLVTGLPGSSNALVIAARLGLSPDIISRAKSYLSREHEELEEIIKNLKKEQALLKENADAAAVDRQKAGELKKTMERESKELSIRKEEIIAGARSEARNLVKQAKEKADESIRELRENLTALKKEKKDNNYLREAESGRRSLHDFMNDLEESTVDSGSDDLTPVDNVSYGDIVYVKSLKQKGSVTQISPDGEVQVQVGDLKIFTSASNIRIPSDTPGKSGDGFRETRSYSLQKHYNNTGNEIMLRGLTLDEASGRLEKYLDDAILLGFEKVFVIHGRGTGRLREGLKDMLKGHRHVSSFRSGYPEEGGIGVTVVTLKR